MKLQESVGNDYTYACAEYRDIIATAIRFGRRLSFYYTAFDPYLHPIRKHAGKCYCISPYDCFFGKETFYVTASEEGEKHLSSLQAANPACEGAFCGYGVAVKDFRNPVIDFDRNDTYIQSEGINQDFGIYDSPDELLKEHGQSTLLFYERE